MWRISGGPSSTIRRAVATWADQPVNENDLHARHVWLLQRRDALRPSLEGDPDYFDAQIAGWWVWGLCSWIGSGWCSGKGPWWVDEHRHLVHLGDAGMGVNRQLVHLGNAGMGDWFAALSARLRHVRVSSGDWSRVCGPSVTEKHGLTGVFLDPPYADTANRTDHLYREDCDQIAHAVRDWAVSHGDHPLLRIALCGYECEHTMPDTWTVHEWNAGQGFGAQAEDRSLNGKKERIWFSPHCRATTQASLFDPRS